MVAPSTGEVVLVPFPFSDLSASFVRSVGMLTPAALTRVTAAVVAVIPPSTGP